MAIDAESRRRSDNGLDDGHLSSPASAHDGQLVLPASTAHLNRMRRSHARASRRAPTANGNETTTTSPPRLLDRLRHRLRARHYSRRTEEAYVPVAPRTTREVKPGSAEANVERPITRDMLVEMFDNMASQGWDLSKPMVWGYFFVDDDRSRLEAARRRLEAKGYEFVEYLQPEEPGDPLMLHVRKVEVHTVETLEARNERFYELAEELGLVAYDGMDVGPIELDPEMKEQDDARH